MARSYLIEQREKRGLTQTKAAKEMGISQNYLSSIETGVRQREIKLNTLARMAKCYRVSVITLVKMEAKYQEEKKSELLFRRGR